MRRARRPQVNPRLTPEKIDTLTRRLMDMIPGNARGVIVSYDRAKVLVKHSGGNLEKALTLYRQRYKANRRSGKKRNPPLTKIYGRVLRVEAQKTGKHQCDSECRKCGHRYYHDFKVSPRMYGLPDGSLLIK